MVDSKASYDYSICYGKLNSFENVANSPKYYVNMSCEQIFSVARCLDLAINKQRCRDCSPSSVSTFYNWVFLL